MALLWFILAQADDPYAEVLRRSGIEPDAAGVVRYLSRLAPTDANRARAADLVRKLGDDDFAARESANEELKLLLPTLRALAGDAMDRAVKSNDLEIQSRVRRLLKEASSAEARFVLRAALIHAGRLKAAGTVEAVLPLIEHVEDSALRRAMGMAMRDAASKADEARLLESLGEGHADRRAAAAGALGRLLADLQPIRALLDDPQERVRLAAARAITDRGDRAGLETLGALLSSKDAAIRQEAVTTLRQATGKHFGFSPFEEGASTKAWTDWIRDEGAAAALTFPLPDRTAELGRTLICIYGEGKVVELDRSGKEIFEATGLNQPWGCTGLPNGHRLVAAYSNQKVTEYDDTGKEIWSKDGLPGGPMSVQRLENGHTLVACSDSNRVLEISRDGSIAREETIEGRTTDVDQLDNGNWLVTLQNGNKVVEVDRSGTVVWTLEGLTSPLAAQRLENGNTLVSEMGAGRVVEYDRAGGKVWVKDGLSSPYDAQRLESGNTLYVDQSGVTEVDPAGNEVWKYAKGSVSRVRRY